MRHKPRSWVRPVLIGAGALLGVSLFSGAAQARPSSREADDRPAPRAGGSKIEILDAMLADAGLPRDWRRFAIMTAAGESRFVANVFLGRPPLKPPFAVLSSSWQQIGESEYQATVRAYNRNADLWSSCPWEQERYTVAGGLFGLLAPNAVYAFRNTELVCIDPWSTFVAAESIPMFIDFCRRVLKNSRMKIKGDWLDLRLGVGALERIGVASERQEMLDKLTSRGILSDLGIPRQWLFETVKPLPKVDLVAVRARLLETYGSSALAEGPG